MLLKKRPKLDSTPEPAAGPGRSSTRERKQRIELDFDPMDSDDEKDDFQPSPSTRKNDKKKSAAVVNEESNNSSSEESPRPITKSKKRPAAVVIEESSEEEYDFDEAEEDDDDDDEYGGKVKKPVSKKSRTALIPISSNNNNRQVVKNKIPIGKFIPLKRANCIPKNPEAKAVLFKKFKVPTIVSASTTAADAQGRVNTTTKTKAASAIAAASSSSSGNFGERKTLGLRSRLCTLKRALYDHTAPDAVVLWDPGQAHVEEEELKITTDKPKKKGKSLAEILGLKKEEKRLVHVVVDPVLGKVLRPHQVEGVKFLYKCTTGQVYPDAYGCIMADEMGLGKTLQCITLLWTLLQQSGEAGKPTINKAIITCPSSLVKNWANELVKWLGESKIRPLVIADTKAKKEKVAMVKRWGATQGKVSTPVLIISYESLRDHAKTLRNAPIGLLLCDEGHRLKNSSSQLFKELNSLTVHRRVILSGTPIQNDLSEYYSLLDFANPGLLGTPNEFRRHYELPILRGRDADATDKERELSDEKVAEFWKIVSKFTIRRTNDILTKYLPVKYESVVFCKLAPLQESLYNVFLTSPEIKTLLRGQGSQPLKAITLLKKLCNHPNLLNLPTDLEGCESVLPADYLQTQGRKINPNYSGKFMVLARMLAKIKKETKDKIVLISNYTQTLDVFDTYCKQMQYGVLRLDGSMNASKRQKLVDQFNNPEGEEFVFLLSSKAGGCGLNLIGANRLVLFDPDWNPAADQQALARVWRDGQKKDCFIYRFLTSGTIEEKIFQRQSHKQSLSNCVVDEATDMERHFSVSEMRQLFTLHTKSECETHDTFKCKRCIQGKQHTPAEAMNYGDTSTWNHYDHDLLRMPDAILAPEAQKGTVRYAFQYISHMK